MTLTNRDKRILIVLPALVMSLGYGTWFTVTGKQKNLTQLRVSAETAEKNKPSGEKLMASQHQLIAVTMESKQAAEKAARTRAELNRQMLCLDPNARADRLHRLTSLMTQYRLTILDHAELGKDTAIPPSAQALKKQLPDARGDALCLHKIRFAARYEDVCGATSALARDGSVAIPVSLAMKESHNFSAWHEWVILVWL